MLAESAGTVEYTNCISAIEHDSANECPSYDIKPSDSEVPVLELRRMRNIPSVTLLPDPDI